MRAGKLLAGCSAVAVLAGASAAQADLEISNHPTLNVSCSAGVCTATADKARLNVTDLANMLASGDVAVKTGSVTGDIEVRQPLSWTGASRLTLDAKRSVEIDRPISVTGSGALTIVTNDGGKNGEFIVFPERGSVQFWDLNSSLIIDGQAYTLVGDIKTLAGDIAANPSGFYALAKDYDASADGTYSNPAVIGSFPGTFEGLGNTISNFKMHFSPSEIIQFGFFQMIAAEGVVREVGLKAVDISGDGEGNPQVGSLVSGNDGIVEGCWATGVISELDSPTSIGGLASGNGGTISRSFARVHIVSANSRYSGGLVAYNAGIISQSYAAASIKGNQGSDWDGGSLIGYNEKGDGRILNSFAVGVVQSARVSCCSVGGLAGTNGSGATMVNTYAGGHVHPSHGSDMFVGGLIGVDEAMPGSIQTSYWDLDKGVSDPSQGAGNVKDDPGITGLTTQQLQSGLPMGFDPKIWMQDQQHNNGLPYLRGLPPPK